METSQQIKDLVDAIIDGNSVESEKVFSDIMTDKISDRIDTYRQQVANSYFNPVAETEEEETEEEITDETE
jgi:hypothetical protein